MESLRKDKGVSHLPRRQHEDAIAVHDRVQPMGDGERCRVELSAHDALDRAVCLDVDGSCGFIQYQKLRRAQQRAR